MRKPLVVLAFVALVAVAAGCNADATPVAARVDGTAIPAADLTAEMANIESASASRCLFSGEALKGAGARTYSTDFAATVLTFMIERQLSSAEVRRLHLSTTPLAVETAAELLEVGLSGSTSGCAATGSSITAALPARFRALLSAYETSQALLASHLAHTALTDASVASFARSHPLETSVACVSDIVVSSAKTAQSIIAKARAGTSFAALARADSVDTSTSSKGGSLGCGPPNEFNSAFAPTVSRLATGAVSGEIALESPYVGIVKVTSRRPGDVLDDAVGAVSAGSGALDVLDAKLAGRGVQVDPAFGQWELSSGSYTVSVPGGPAEKDLVNVAAITPQAPASSG